MFVYSYYVHVTLGDQHSWAPENVKNITVIVWKKINVFVVDAHFRGQLMTTASVFSYCPPCPYQTHCQLSREAILPDRLVNRLTYSWPFLALRYGFGRVTVQLQFLLPSKIWLRSKLIFIATARLITVL